MNGQTNGPCPNWTFDTSTNRISTASFTYDAAGNLTADGTHSYQWDGEGRLVTVDNGATIVLVYNALGQQVGVTKGGTDVVWHLKSPADKSQGDYAPSYVGWNPAGVFFLGDKRVGFDVNGGMVFLHQNNLNSVTVPTTFDGSRFDDILYYPWGQYWAGEGFVFAGMDHYWEDVLHNTPNRQYAFYEGRWLSPDPLAGDVTNPQSLNRYAYVLGNPTTLTDPLGLGRDRPLPPKTGGDPGCDPFTGVGCPPDGGGGGIDPCSDPWYADSHAECGTPPPPPPPGGGGGGGGGGGRTSPPCGGGVGTNPLPTIASAFQTGVASIQCQLCKAGCDVILGAAAGVVCGALYAAAEGAVLTVDPPAVILEHIGIEISAHVLTSAGIHELAKKCVEKFAEKKESCYKGVCSSACREGRLPNLPF